MSFKVGDEVELPRYDGARKGFGRGKIISIHQPGRFPVYGVEFKKGKYWIQSLQLACPIARESAKLKADVERFEVEIDAWIERMRRGEL